MDFPGFAGPHFDPDSVSLVGAGVPGEPGLLTLHSASTLIPLAPVIALRPLPAGWPRVEPTTVASEAVRARANR